MLGVDLCLMGEQLVDEGRPGFSMFWKLTRRQENTRSTISQYVIVLNLETAQLRHGNRVHFGRRDLAIAQQLPGIGTGRLAAAKVFPKAARLELHICATLITLDDRTVVAFNPELARLHFIAITIGVVATDMQLARLINKITVHSGMALATTTLAQQQTRFRLIISIDADRLVTRREIDGFFTTLLGWQVIARAAEENSRTRGPNLQRTSAIVAGNTGRRRVVRLHALWPIDARLHQFSAEVVVKFIQQISPG